jgi:hypothetical protein
MGIFVRLILSLAGSVVGAAIYASLPWAVGWGVLYLRYRTQSGLSYAQAQSEINAILFATSVVSLGFIYAGAKHGYKIGLQMGRDICFAPEPEQNSRVNLTLNAETKKNAT